MCFIKDDMVELVTPDQAMNCSLPRGVIAYKIS